MSSAWVYIAVFLFGFAAGVIVAVKWIVDPGTDYSIGKIKMRGKHNDQRVSVDMSEVKKTGRQRRQERKAARRVK